LILLIGGTASDDDEAKAEAEVVAREDKDGRAKVEAGAGIATVGARGEISVSFMMKEIL